MFQLTDNSQESNTLYLSTAMLKIVNAPEIIMLKQDINKHFDEQNNVTLLHLAVCNNSLEAFQYFLAEGADPCQVDNAGNTPLHYISKLNLDHEFIDLLLKTMNSNNQMDENSIEQPKKKQKTTETTITTSDYINLQNSNGYTALYFAYQVSPQNDLSISMPLIWTLLNEGANLFSQAKETRYTPIELVYLAQYSAYDASKVAEIQNHICDLHEYLDNYFPQDREQHSQFWKNSELMSTLTLHEPDQSPAKFAITHIESKKFALAELYFTVKNLGNPLNFQLTGNLSLHVPVAQGELELVKSLLKAASVVENDPMLLGDSENIIFCQDGSKEKLARYVNQKDLAGKTALYWLFKNEHIDNLLLAKNIQSQDDQPVFGDPCYINSGIDAYSCYWEDNKKIRTYQRILSQLLESGASGVENNTLLFPTNPLICSLHRAIISSELKKLLLDAQEKDYQSIKMLINTTCLMESLEEQAYRWYDKIDLLLTIIQEIAVQKKRDILLFFLKLLNQAFNIKPEAFNAVTDTIDPIIGSALIEIANHAVLEVDLELFLKSAIYYPRVSFRVYNNRCSKFETQSLLNNFPTPRSLKKNLSKLSGFEKKIDRAQKAVEVAQKNQEKNPEKLSQAKLTLQDAYNERNQYDPHPHPLLKLFSFAYPELAENSQAKKSVINYFCSFLSISGTNVLALEAALLGALETLAREKGEVELLQYLAEIVYLKVPSKKMSLKAKCLALDLKLVTLLRTCLSRTELPEDDLLKNYPHCRKIIGNYFLEKNKGLIKNVIRQQLTAILNEIDVGNKPISKLKVDNLNTSVNDFLHQKGLYPVFIDRLFREKNKDAIKKFIDKQRGFIHGILNSKMTLLRYSSAEMRENLIESYFAAPDFSKQTAKFESGYNAFPYIQWFKQYINNDLTSQLIPIIDRLNQYEVHFTMADKDTRPDFIVNEMINAQNRLSSFSKNINDFIDSCIFEEKCNFFKMEAFVKGINELLAELAEQVESLIPRYRLSQLDAIIHLFVEDAAVVKMMLLKQVERKYETLQADCKKKKINLQNQIGISTHQREALLEEIKQQANKAKSEYDKKVENLKGLLELKKAFARFDEHRGRNLIITEIPEENFLMAERILELFPEFLQDVVDKAKKTPIINALLDKRPFTKNTNRYPYFDFLLEKGANIFKTCERDLTRNQGVMRGVFSFHDNELKINQKAIQYAILAVSKKGVVQDWQKVDGPTQDTCINNWASMWKFPVNLEKHLRWQLTPAGLVCDLAYVEDKQLEAMKFLRQHPDGCELTLLYNEGISLKTLSALKEKNWVIQIELKVEPEQNQRVSTKYRRENYPEEFRTKTPKS